MASAESILQTKRAGFVGLGRLGLCGAHVRARGMGHRRFGRVSGYVESINDRA